MRQGTCSVTGQSYVIRDEEVSFAKSMDMPLLPLCPEERLRQLMATRNEWKLYHRTCDKTGEKILGAYPSDSPYTVYKNDVWWGDSWEALDYGQDFDFNRPFFEQSFELQIKVPREGTSVFQSENCDYNSHIRQSKDCYLNSLVVRARDMHYFYWMVDVEDTLDSCLHIHGKSSLCYECIDFGTCFNAVALQECYNSSDCAFSYQLHGCDHCIFCSNLNNLSYHIENKPCSKEEFDVLRTELLNGSYRTWLDAYRKFLDIRSQSIHRSSQTINCENVVGDHIFDSKNCYYCFDGDHGEDCSVGGSVNDSKDIHSFYSAGWPRCERLWNCAVSRGCIDMAFTRYMWFCNDMRYCDSCQTCKHCFGCTGLRHKDYCILNKQYSKEDFENLREKIIVHMKKTDEWGKFWPYETLPYAYNESAAQDYFPIAKDEALQRGFQWRDQKEESPKVQKVIPATKLPDSIDDVTDDILNQAIECRISGRPFKLIKAEIDFYRRMRLPLPREHPEERHKRRMSMRNPYKLWSRTCTKCGKAIETTYSPERPEKIYCEECYLKEVY